jgi:hypothetical protein
MKPRTSHRQRGGLKPFSQLRRRRLDGLLERIGPLDLHLPLVDLVAAGGIENVELGAAEAEVGDLPVFAS